MRATLLSMTYSGYAINEGMADVPANTQTKPAHVPLFGLLPDILEQTLRVPHLAVSQNHDFQIQILEVPLDGRFDRGSRVSIPSQCLWASTNNWLEYGRNFSQRKECCEPKEQVLKLTSRDFRGAMREDMLPDLSTMNTTSGIALFGRLNLGMRVTMRAFELRMMGCT